MYCTYIIYDSSVYRRVLDFFCLFFSFFSRFRNISLLITERDVHFQLSMLNRCRSTIIDMTITKSLVDSISHVVWLQITTADRKL